MFNTKELINLGWVAIPGMLISSSNGFVDKFIMSRYLSFDKVAIYSIAAILSVNLGRVFIASSLKGSSISLLHYCKENDFYRIKRLLFKVEWFFSITLLLYLIFYYFYAQEILLYLFGAKYLASFVFILPLFMAVLLEGIMQFYSNILIQNKKLHLVVFNAFIIFILSLPLNLSLIPSLGIYGAVTTFFIANFILFIIVFFQIKRELKILKFPFIFITLCLIVFLFELLRFV